MSVKLASGVTVFAAYGLFLAFGAANGCSSPASRGNPGSSGTGTGTGTGTMSQNSSASSSTGTSGSTSTMSSSGGGGSISAVCGCPTTMASATDLIYNGGIPVGTCPTQFTFDGVTNNWFGYNDGTSDGGFTHNAMEPGCGGAGSCAYYASSTGGGFINYGAGVGLTLNNNANFDASNFNGLMVYMMGTTQGTRTNGFMPENDIVHVKLVTALPDGGDERNGDDYGGYCPLDNDAGAGCYTLCQLPFAGLTRDGFRGVDSGAPNPATDMFDPQNLQKIQFEFSLYSAPDGGVPEPVNFNVVIGYVTFY